MSKESNGELYDYVYPYIKNKLVFDIGSNIGEVTKKFVKHGAKVVAVEPQVSLLTNENYKGVFSIENLCVSDKKDDIIFYKANQHTVSTCSKNWTDFNKTYKWNKIKVKCTTLDFLIKKYGKPKYIKIDVENFEDSVLRGLSRKIDIISFEFTQGFEDNFTNCLKIVEKLGFNKIITFVKKKIKKKSKVIRTYKIVDEFTDIKSAINLFKKLPKRCQGDLLVL